MLILGQNRRFFVLCDLEIWQMTLKNNRAPLLCCFKLCASFHSHQWTLPGVTVRKCPIWVKIDNFFSPVTLTFDGWPWKTIGHLPLPGNIKLYASFHHMYYSNWSYSPEMVKLGFDLCDLNLWPLTLTSYMDLTLVVGNNSWKFHDDTMMGTYRKSMTDGQTDIKYHS